MAMYTIKDRETNNWVLNSFATLEEAEKCITDHETMDTINGTYEPDFYQIIEE